MFITRVSHNVFWSHSLLPLMFSRLTSLKPTQHFGIFFVSNIPVNVVLICIAWVGDLPLKHGPLARDYILTFPGSWQLPTSPCLVAKLMRNSHHSRIWSFLGLHRFLVCLHSHCELLCVVDLLCPEGSLFVVYHLWFLHSSCSLFHDDAKPCEKVWNLFLIYGWSLCRPLFSAFQPVLEPSTTHHLLLIKDSQRITERYILRDDL